jgi:(p)ppGpp synthase/HD superfamily hydrolase
VSSRSIIDEAREFARLRHAFQIRKYTGEPYFNHCAAVANIVSAVGGDDAMIAAAYLHDVVEDCDVTIEEIKSKFGDDIASLVSDLTDVSKKSDGNRKVRKEIDRQHTAKASPRAKTIKLADLISNCEDIMDLDPKFGEVYLAEKELLLEVLTEGNQTLYTWAKIVVDEQ